MSSQVIKVSRPTRLELIKLKRRLALARKYYGILKDRETFLLQAFRETYLRLVEDRKRLNSLLAEALDSYYTALNIHGWSSIVSQSSSVKESVSFITRFKNILGLWTLSYEPSLKLSPFPHLLPELARLQRVRNEIVEVLARIIEGERALVNIGNEISRLKRVVNTLEKVYIPRLEKTIKYLSMKFDEIQREETIRILRVKRMLEAKAVS